MTLDDFTRLLDTYGADLRRWPAQERVAAGRLIATSERARRLQADAQKLDQLLAQDRAHPAGPARGPAIVRAALDEIRAQPTPVGLSWLLAQPAAMVLAPLALAGCIAGWMMAPLLDAPQPRSIPAVMVLLDETGPLAREIFP